MENGHKKVNVLSVVTISAKYRENVGIKISITIGKMDGQPVCPQDKYQQMKRKNLSGNREASVGMIG